MDEFTRAHLNIWLRKNVSVEEEGVISKLMVVKYSENPDMWSRRGWPDLCKAIGATEVPDPPVREYSDAQQSDLYWD